MRRIRVPIGVVVLLVMALMFGCGTSKYKTMYGISDWYYTNHITLESQYASSTPEQQAWLRKNVNPYMNIMRQLVIAMKAIDEKNEVKVAQCISEIMRHATGITYDVSRMVQAIKDKDYDTLFSESLALKSFIINKLSERR